MFTFNRAAAALLAVGLAALPLPSLAHEFKAGSITIGHPWSRATPPGAKTGAGYLKLDNGGTADDRLVSASSPAAAEVQIHEMRVEDGVMTMRALPAGLTVPAGGKVALEPRGAHLMMLGLKQPLKEGDKVPLTLGFEKSGSVEVWLAVEGIAANADGSAGDEQGHEGH